jgi:hypothetical protein
MSLLDQLPAVSECSAASCSYNEADKCKAPAITVSGSTKCVTFIPLTVKGGFLAAVSHVGACQQLDCTHNHDLECNADSIEIGSETAACLAFVGR